MMHACHVLLFTGKRALSFVHVDMTGIVDTKHALVLETTGRIDGIEIIKKSAKNGQGVA